MDSASKSANFNPVNTMTDGFNSTFQSFMNKVTKTAISEDFSTALQNTRGFFFVFDISRSRGQRHPQIAFESVAVLLLDVLKAVIDTLVDLLVQTLKIGSYVCA